MFDSIGWDEIVVLALAALFIFGPDRLPGLAEEAAGALQRLRSSLAGVRGTVDEHLGDEAAAQARCRPDPHPPPAQLRHLLHLQACRLGVGQDALGEREQRLTGVGERDVPAGPLEQLGAQLPFQSPHLLRQRRLCDVLALRRKLERRQRKIDAVILDRAPFHLDTGRRA